MQSDKIQILSTRLLDEAITAKACDYNIHIDAIPFINTQHLYSDDLNLRLQALSKENICTVFTSINAVSAVAEQLSDIPVWKIFCTGGKTKEYVIKSFGEDNIVATAKNANILAERIIASGRVVKVIFFCGDQRLNDLPEKLKNNNIQVDEVVVYTTVQTPVFIEKNYDSILFFSPSAAHSFFSMNTIPTSIVLFSIGQTTTAAIQTYCTNKIITSEWPGTESLLELVTDFYTEASR